MQVKYFPKLNPDYSKIAGRDVAYAVLLPDKWDKALKWPAMLSVHGIGERSGGTLENLKNLVEGFDYNNDGIRDNAYVTADMKTAVDKYGLVIIVPTYESDSFFDANKSGWVMASVNSEFSLKLDYWYDGFSLGAGAAINACTSVLTAPNIVFATPCAPTNSIGNAALVAQNNIVVHIYVNDQDDNGPTNLSVTKAIIAEINKYNPPVPAIYTAFHKFGHGGHNEAMTLTPPKAPGGQGFVDAAENNYEHFLDILKNGPRQMKSGTVQPVQPAQVALTADFNLSDGQVITTTIFDMDASNSTGVKDSWDGYKWDVKPVGPAAGKQYGVRADGAYGGPKKKLIDIVDGQYEIVLTVRNSAGSTAQKKVTVTAKIGAAKTLIAFDSSTDIATYSDGSTEKATAVLKDGKWTIKNSAGQIF